LLGKKRKKRVPSLLLRSGGSKKFTIAWQGGIKSKAHEACDVRGGKIIYISVKEEDDFPLLRGEK